MAGKIMLSGGSGMVGRNLLDAAVNRNVEIIAPSSRELNLFDAKAVFSYIRRLQPDLIVHAAGRVGGIQANIRNPVDFLIQNWDMGRNLVLAAQEAGVRRLINLGSSCMYPRDSLRALKEEDILTGPLESTNEGYALAKISVARLCEYVSRETPELQYKTLIPCNIYGPHDKFEPTRSHLIPAVIHKLHLARIRNEEVSTIWGDGTARREFMYAGDLADAILKAVEHFDSLPMVMNVGMGLDFSVNEYYESIAEIVGYKGIFVHDLTKPVGMARKLTDVRLALSWGWHAKTSLHDGLQLTYSFYLNSGEADALSVS